MKMVLATGLGIFATILLTIHSGATVCLVTHGLTLKLLVTKALGFEIHEWVKTPWQHNTALNIFEIEEQQWIPRIVGDCMHLDELELKSESIIHQEDLKNSVK